MRSKRLIYCNTYMEAFLIPSYLLSNLNASHDNLLPLLSKGTSFLRIAFPAPQPVGPVSDAQLPLRAPLFSPTGPFL